MIEWLCLNLVFGAERGKIEMVFLKLVFDGLVSFSSGAELIMLWICKILFV